MKTSRYNFLKLEWPNLFKVILDIEKNLLDNPNISMIKLRQLVEFTIKYIIQYENIQLPKEKFELKNAIELFYSINQNYILELYETRF